MSHGGILVKENTPGLGVMRAPAEKTQAKRVSFLHIGTGRGTSRSPCQGWSETPGPPCIEQRRFPEDNFMLFEALRSDASLPQELSLNTIHLNISEVSFSIVCLTWKSLVPLKTKHFPPEPVSLSQGAENKCLEWLKKSSVKLRSQISFRY